MGNAKQQSLWILKSKGDESSFGGNEGYPDQIESHYVFDNHVKNFDKIRPGDLIVIVGKKNIEGFAKVERIDIEKGVHRKRFRCPICNTQEHYPRKKLLPKYKCRNKHFFDEPSIEDIIVDQYTAEYGSTFISAPPGSSTQLLSGFYINRNLYYSIQPATSDFIDRSFPAIAHELDGFKNGKKGNKLRTDSNLPTTPYSPGPEDTRSVKTSRRVTRKGQQKFRENLFKIYGTVCMLSGCRVAEAIEASHIIPYRGENDNHQANGLLLRRDLHALFDADLLGIEPVTLRITVHPHLSGSEYARFKGEKLNLDRTDFQPSIEALKFRWGVFNQLLLEIQ